MLSSTLSLGPEATAATGTGGPSPRLQVMRVEPVIEEVPLPVRHSGDGTHFRVHCFPEAALESRADGCSHVVEYDGQMQS